MKSRVIFLVILILIRSILSCNDSKRAQKKGSSIAKIKIEKGESGLKNKKMPKDEEIVKRENNTIADTNKFLNLDEDKIIERLKYAKLKDLKKIGLFSFSFYFNLEGEIDCNFKPQTYKGPRWRMEIAAYRIGKLLGLNLIPPVTLRMENYNTIEELLKKKGDKTLLEEVNKAIIKTNNGYVKGSAQYWVPYIEHSQIDTFPEYLKNWAKLLSQSYKLEEGEIAFSNSLSKMITFDYLIGNWDRWSGGNVIFTKYNGEKVLLFMDHNNSFLSPMPTHLQDKLEKPFLTVQRFSRSLLHSIETLSREKIYEILKEDPTLKDEEILTDTEIKDVLMRKEKILERVRELSLRYSKEKVVCFE